MHNLPLADEFFLIGHDEKSGKPQTNSDVLNSGLAAAVLGELIMAGRLTVSEDGLVVPVDRRPCGEWVTDAAFSEILKQPHAHAVRAWIEFLRADVCTMVAPRLLQAGLVAKDERAGMFRKGVRYPAIDPLRALVPRSRLRFMLDNPKHVDEATALLGGLVQATGLARVFEAGTARHVRGILATMVGGLPQDMRLLCAGTDAAVAAVALTIRR